MAIRAKQTPIAGAIAAAIFMGLAAAPASGETAGNSANRPNAQGGASSATSTPARNAGASQQATMVDMRASKLMGKSVRNAQGKDLGELADMVVDIRNNRILYAIVERGGVLGIGDKATAVPIRQFRSGARDGELVLNMTEQQLKDSPALKGDVQWNDPRTWDNIGQYYHRTLGMPGADQSETADSKRFQRASEILGMDVIDTTGDEVGEIEDLIVNLSNGSVHYAVLEFDRAWNPVDKLVALPMSALKPKEGSNDLTINLTREQLANAPSFEASRWPDLRDSQFRDRVAGFGRSSTTGMQSQDSGGAGTSSGQASSPSSSPSGPAGTSSRGPGGTPGSGSTGQAR